MSAEPVQLVRRWDWACPSQRCTPGRAGGRLWALPGGCCPELSTRPAAPHPAALSETCPGAGGKDAAQPCCSAFHVLGLGLLESRACALSPLCSTAWPSAGTPTPQVQQGVSACLLNARGQNLRAVQGWLCSFPAPTPLPPPQLDSFSGEDGLPPGFWDSELFTQCPFGLHSC